VAFGALCVSAWVAHGVQARLRQATLDRRFEERRAAARVDTTGDESGPRSSHVATDDLIGRIEIPGRDVSAPILRGIDRAILDVAVGQIPGTAEFDGHGNVGLAGHRDTHFRGLRNVRAGDRITIQTAEGSLEYEVLWTKVTIPEDVEVIAPQSADVLTLVTCFPFQYVGSAPCRFVVRAARAVS
jgi:sortase A